MVSDSFKVALCLQSNPYYWFVCTTWGHSYWSDGAEIRKSAYFLECILPDNQLLRCRVSFILWQYYMLGFVSFHVLHLQLPSFWSRFTSRNDSWVLTLNNSAYFSFKIWISFSTWLRVMILLEIISIFTHELAFNYFFSNCTNISGKIRY